MVCHGCTNFPKGETTQRLPFQLFIKYCIYMLQRADEANDIMQVMNKSILVIALFNVTRELLQFGLVLYILTIGVAPISGKTPLMWEGALL